MVRRDTSRDSSTLMRDEGNDLASNYDLHDVAEAHIHELLTDNGLMMVPWGIDMRHDDDALIFGDRMDLFVFDPQFGEYMDMEIRLGSVIEVKSKSHRRWMGKMNERHWNNYLDVDDRMPVPCFVVFCQIDDDEIVDERWCRVDEAEVLHRFTFPDGNKGVKVGQTHTRREVLEDIKGL